MTFHYMRFPGADTRELTPRPCFVCGEMMDVVKPTRQLFCKPCDILEACHPIVCMPLTLTVMSGDWEGTDYIDHSKIYAPTP